MPLYEGREWLYIGLRSCFTLYISMSIWLRLIILSNLPWTFLKMNIEYNMGLRKELSDHTILGDRTYKRRLNGICAIIAINDFINVIKILRTTRYHSRRFCFHRLTRILLTDSTDRLSFINWGLYLIELIVYSFIVNLQSNADMDNIYDIMCGLSNF